ncbi:MAG: hypothetical protein WBM02_02320 [bacterium]
MKTKKLILAGVKCKKVDGIMNDQEKLSIAQTKITKETEAKFEEYRKVRIQAMKKAIGSFVD